MNTSRLNGKVAVVTGGNSGIGLGIAKRFQSEGAVGAIVGRSQATLDHASEALGPNFFAIQSDLTKIESIPSIFEAVKKTHGEIDTLVCNAGGAIGPGSVGPFAEVDEKSFDGMFDLNFKSVFFTVQGALPYLKDGASIVLIASIAATKPFEGMSVYSSCKAGVAMLAKVLAKELLPRKIRVNVVSPGTIETPVFKRMGLPEEHVAAARQSFVDLIPVGRIGEPEDIAAAVAYLAADESSFVLGQELVVDGGVLAD